jgi:UDP-GlcNAc:undecaprenyl-phosphate GlcNAc-1-phosphate transferase
MLFLLFSIGVLLSAFCTLVVCKIAAYFKILDIPDDNRKKHKKPTPLLGGLAIWSSFWIHVLLVVYFVHGSFASVAPSQWWGIFLGSCIIITIGVVDDIYSVAPWIRLICAVVASALVVVSGVGLKIITNPFGGIVNLNYLILNADIFSLYVTIGDFVVFFWIIGMMFTTKILDGLDGLATGITLIGSLVIFFLTQTTKFYQPEVGMLALVFAGSCAGFLLFNFHPARIFLGESGSLFLGFMLAILAVISGGKIATALLVMAIPIFDIVRVIYLRVKNNRSVFLGDREHLHFRMLDSGLSETRAVLLLYAIAFLFGIATLFLQSKAKLFVLILVGCSMLFLTVIVHKKSAK